MRLADDSNDVPNLCKRQYADFKLTQSDWLQLSLLHEVLQVNSILHLLILSLLTFSCRNLLTLYRASPAQKIQLSGKIPVLEFLQESWQNMAVDKKFSSIAHGLQAGLENLGKWSQKTDETDVYFICLGASPSRFLFKLICLLILLVTALNPNYKLEYAHSQWDSEASDNGMRKLEAIVSTHH